VEEIAKRYAHAFFECNEQVAAQLESELGEVWAQVATHNELGPILRHPEVDMSAKKEIVARLTKTFLPQTQKCLDLLLEHKRLELLGDIVTAFRRLRLAAEGQVEVRVQSILAIDPTVKEQIVQMVQKITGLKPLIAESLDDNLLGGIRLEFGDVLIDGSARKSLSECIAIIRGK
jgi:F-type H+-transporting ATPase subunit delta